MRCFVFGHNHVTQRGKMKIPSLLLCAQGTIAHLEVSHSLEVLHGERGLYFLNAVHHGSAYHNVGYQETCRPARENMGE